MAREPSVYVKQLLFTSPTLRLLRALCTNTTL